MERCDAFCYLYWIELTKNCQIYIDTCDEPTEEGHICAGYYLPYPDQPHEGLVTTITKGAPIMNWMFVDIITNALRYGIRVSADDNLTGPFDCTRESRRLTFQGWEGFW